MNIGLGIEFLPNDTEEDRRFVATLQGMYKTPEEEAVERLKRLANKEALAGVKMELPASIPIVARVPIEEGGDTGPRYEILAEKLTQLRVATDQLLRRIN